ncbi:unnamed protein product [Acanthoscelides obtectus]|uniref:Uncharacterized protein n=1 Tax=Acanthoscelides obtectus TaxID=200917 RepID=A0A9P0QI21_ACAOB|nr:unnamed protein product [Acanthoscelides obtectus]CAK1684140.1 hypothetical protein AOBTE_LOCUS34652 [Acanthoscelides obtectus]
MCVQHCSGDESWIYCYESENKRQSAVWVLQAKNVTADWYTTICLPKTNASSHTAQKTRQYLTEEKPHADGINLRGEYFEKQ